MSLWQIRNALEVNRIVPTFVIQYDGRVENSRDALVRSYQAFIDELTTIPAQVQAFDTSSSMTSVTEDLIRIIEDAYNVSMTERTMPRYGASIISKSDARFIYTLCQFISLGVYKQTLCNFWNFKVIYFCLSKCIICLASLTLLDLITSNSIRNFVSSFSVKQCMVRMYDIVHAENRSDCSGITTTEC